MFTTPKIDLTVDARPAGAQGGLKAVFGNPGYYSASSSGGQLVAAPMQIGVNLRYTFGAR